MNPIINRKIGLFLGIFLLGSGLFAQESVGISQDSLTSLLFVLSISFALICLVLALTIYALIKPKTEKATKEAEVQTRQWSWNKFSERINARVPMEQEAGITLDHNYDGIMELDNRLPPWWLIGFYISIVFGVVYMWVYDINGTWSSTQAYEEEVAEAEIAKANYLEKLSAQVDESNVVFLTGAAELAEGEKLYQQLCAVCHIADGGGNIGPNLTDQYWLHGGSITDIFKTIKYGVPEKGMISWQEQLNPKQMQQVASFIKTLQGTTPATPKDPQGELFKEAPEAPTTSDTTQLVMNQ
ncbi:MAG: cbb3-type cytochrome c oxidase N-terminal domain-containing protein [Bacteroidota bacterium]